LLDIFDLYRKSQAYSLPTLGEEHVNVGLVWKWHLLVHVCRRWRQIIFGSPCRLELQILCTYRTPARDNLSIWPAFPIVINGGRSSVLPDSEDNVIAALEHPDRVSFVLLAGTGSQLAKMVTVMQKPFPVLKHLHIVWRNGVVPVLPVEFLGGSAPSLQAIVLRGVSFPALPTLLLSTRDLVNLHLHGILRAGYSTEVMVACLAALPKLKTFIVKLVFDTATPDRIHPLTPMTRTVLPALTLFQFYGASKDLEDLVAQIDGPQLDQIHIFCVDKLVDFPVAQFTWFVNLSVGPKLSLFRHARVGFFKNLFSISIHRPQAPDTDLLARSSPDWDAKTIVSYEWHGWELSDMAQVFSGISATLSNVVHLELEAKEHLEGTEYVDWLHLLLQFSTVQTLHVRRALAEDVARPLDRITGEMATQVLPSLDLIYLAGQPASSVGNFVAARQLSGRPVTVINSEPEFIQRVRSYISK